MGFAGTAEPLFSVDLPDYDAIHKWSIESPDQFWKHAWNDLGLVGEMGDRILIREKNLQESVFFPDATLNIA